jgi:predicted  nucleic acid-binding Zn-ribbon protein
MELRAQEYANRIEAIDQRMEPIKAAANEARKVHSELQSQLDEMEVDWTEQKRIGTDEQSRISEEYNEALKHRNRTAGEISAHHLGEYNRLFKNNGGMAVTMVKRDICAGCSERVSMGELNVLKQATEPILCHCGKYLITLSTD